MKDDSSVHTTGTDTKMDILNATVELIQEEGVACATLRRISEKAETNLALVNYHFGSKDKLISKAIGKLVGTFDDAFAVLEDDSMEPIERLKQFFYRYLSHLQQYPGLAKEMMDQSRLILCSQHEYARYSKVMKTEKLLSTLSEITQESDDTVLGGMMVQLYGAVFYPVIMNSYMNLAGEEPAPEIHLPTLEHQIEMLFNLYFHKYSQSS
ncbi:TetR/AcrR family transcriptional regulator [Paenibacillus dokdonensis]|uniref:TetR/AcrR family transcriptional regulator n=1 Tax=Paenibacillus dokdonensis TaxID=2567944 RepID=A0ABU6GM21_9BACL|nr:TetR/AcrR family transcriptional regulator [Paenibacillus dokdonensis]MEC0240785.1 TetR/AcrR family transcriptional regulator [Paenibacillus dokdonensis]